MRKSKLILSALIAIISINLGFAQEALAYVAIPGEYVVSNHRKEVKELRIDKTGIIEISDYLSEHVSFPYDEFDFTSEIRVKVQVSLNAFGEVIDYHLVESTKESVGQNVLQTLGNIKSVSPILINGSPKARTIQIPLIFKK